jgi:hypothetical protein
MKHFEKIRTEKIERSALSYQNVPEFRKTIIDRALQFYRNKKLKGSGNILSFIERK